MSPPTSEVVVCMHKFMYKQWTFVPDVLKLPLGLEVKTLKLKGIQDAILQHKIRLNADDIILHKHYT